MKVRGWSQGLGLTSGEAELLLARARNDLGARGLVVRHLAFAAACAPGLRRLLPRRLRRAAIRPFVYALIPGPAENLLYAGTGAARKVDEERASRA